MIPNWLKNKQPDELPNLETVMDIFIELEDTKKYSIQNLSFNYDSKRPDINFNDVYYASYCYVKPNYDTPRAHDTDDWLERMSGVTSIVEVVEKKYRIRRLKWRFVIDRLRTKLHEDDSELEEVVLRLKDYLGENLEDIHYQFVDRHIGSQIIIDSMLYECVEL